MIIVALQYKRTVFSSIDDNKEYLQDCKAFFASMSSFYSTFTMCNRNWQNPRLQKVALYFVCLTSCFISYGYCIYLYAYFYIYTHIYIHMYMLIAEKKDFADCKCAWSPTDSSYHHKMYSSLHMERKRAISPYSSAVFVLQMLHNFRALISFSLALVFFFFFPLLSYAENNEEAVWFSAQSFYLCISIVVILFPSVIL